VAAATLEAAAWAVPLVAGVLSATLVPQAPVAPAAPLEVAAASLEPLAAALAPVAPAAPRERPKALRTGRRTEVLDAEIPIARGATNSPA
jgi:hypothetical protein